VKRIEKIVEERRIIMLNLERDLDVDEDHRWRAQQYRRLAEIEDKLAEIDDQRMDVDLAAEILLSFGTYGTGEELFDYLETNLGWDHGRAERFVQDLTELSLKLDK